MAFASATKLVQVTFRDQLTTIEQLVQRAAVGSGDIVALGPQVDTLITTLQATIDTIVAS